MTSNRVGRGMMWVLLRQFGGGWRRCCREGGGITVTYRVKPMSASRPFGCSPSLFVMFLAMVVVFVVGVLLKPSKPPQKGPTRRAEHSTPSRFTSLSNEERNAIWWEVEKSNSEIAGAIQSRWSEKGNLSDVAFVRKLDREIRTPIAEKHGITYRELKQLFREGETASWRTNVQK